MNCSVEKDTAKAHSQAITVLRRVYKTFSAIRIDNNVLFDVELFSVDIIFVTSVWLFHSMLAGTHLNLLVI